MSGKRICLYWMVAAVVAVVMWTSTESHAADGEWNVDADGNWSDTGNWLDGIVADGADSTATFDGISGNRTVTLDTARTIGNISFDDGSHHLAITGANTLTLDTTSGMPTIDVDDEELTITSVIDGNDGLAKVGAGILRLNAANTFTGGISLSNGAIYVRSSYDPASFGDAANVLTFSGNATLHNVAGQFTVPQGIMINSGVTAQVTGAYGERTQVDGVLAGSGLLYVQGYSAGYDAEFRNTSNTFTGPIEVRSGDSITLGMRSLADSTNSIALDSAGNNGAKFEYMSGATAPLVLNSRQFELIVNGSAGGNLDRQPGILNNAGTTNTITINTDLLITGTGAKHLILGGGNTGDNTFAGDIPDAIGADALHLYKQNGGRWILSGSNSYTGTTTVSGGTLVLNGEQCLPDEGTLNIASGTVEVEVREAVGILQFDGTPQVSGTWGSSSSKADHPNDTYFSGPGLLYVGVGFPPPGTILSIR